MKLIFTNGCFDVLHRGHIELLKYCKTLGHWVIVAINSDKSVSRIKDPSRPINTQEDRKHMLMALKYVDEVIIFDDDTPYELIKLLQPDIIVKGGDYSIKDVVGNDLCEVKLFEYVNGYSTTEAIQNLSDRGRMH